MNSPVDILEANFCILHSVQADARIIRIISISQRVGGNISCSLRKQQRKSYIMPVLQVSVAKNCMHYEL